MRFLAIALLIAFYAPARAEDAVLPAASASAAPQELVDLVRALPKQPGVAPVAGTTPSGLPLLYRLGAEALRDRPALQPKAKPLFDLYLHDAEAGDAIARASVARMFQAGAGAARDETQAFRWMLLAAQQGLTEAKTSLAVCYLDGRGTSKDAAEAFRWASLGAEENDAVAWSLLGYLYRNGIGTRRDAQASREWTEKAAERGEPYAMLNLADHYRFGIGVAPDRQRALELKLKAIAIFRAYTSDEATLNEDVRRRLVQAQAAIREKQFKEALGLLRDGQRYAPWSPLLYYNEALVEGESGQYEAASWDMEVFLKLSPEAPQARGAQDLIYEWERKVKKSP